jgi:hypothetical protein
MNTIDTTNAVGYAPLAAATPNTTQSVEELPSLLVPPSGDAESDALLILLMVQGQDRDEALASGRADVQQLKTRIQQALAQMKAALKKAAEAKKKSGFWGKLGGSLGGVGRWAAVGVAVVVAVGTLGAATPVAALAIAGAVMSMAAACQGQWHVLEKTGLDPTQAGMLGVGLSVAGAACTLGASGFGCGGVADLATDAGEVAAGSAAVGEGVTNLEQAFADRDAGYAQADAQQARADQAHAQQLIQWVLENMEDTEDQHERQIDRGAQTMNMQQQSMMLATTRA